ncbi:hypothetical protein HDU87_001948 [Geranomyces variabilis]|uniref:histone acetyltransferase n=1 Tax=Geranomyces variabilis TaxID=109894 RepID=A0AAD5TP35_9FUNG|nr:hypothetical protein HDU87_001948 [Geranomyces variabilis]
MTSPNLKAMPAPSPSNASASLAARLLAALPVGLRQQLQQPVSLRIFTLSSPPRSATSVLPNCPDAVATDRILLLAQASSSSTSSLATPAVFISALRATEYLTPSHTHIHIAKLDTSGYHERASLARALAAAYISHTTAAAFSPSITSAVSIHVFARAQPAYLFPGSEHNTAKRALSDRALLKWWVGTLAGAVATTTAAASANAHLYVPGETMRSLRDVWAACSATTTTTALDLPRIAWEWGLAPCVSDVNGAGNATAALDQQRARDVVVRFPDDARTKVLDSHADAETTVAELQDMLALTGECTGRLSGFFQVELRSIDNGDSSLSAPSAASAWPPALTRAAFDAAERFLMGLEFATLEDAVRSSRLLQEHLTSAGSTPMTFDVHPAPAGSEPSQQHSLPAKVSEKCKQPADAAEPAAIQSFVKRKDAPTTNSVQNLVKRAKPAMGVEPALVQNLVKRKAAAVPDKTRNTSAK